MVRAAALFASATRQTCQPDGTNVASPARDSTTSGVRHRTKAMAPRSALPSIVSYALATSRACSLVHTIVVLLYALEPSHQTLHRLRFIATHMQTEFTMPLLLDCNIHT